MIASLTALADAGGEIVVASALVFFRIGAALAVLPAFGESSVPMRVRLVLALAFTTVVAPAIPHLERTAPTDIGGFLVSMPGEIVAGLAIGLLLRLVVIALQVAGAIAAQSTSLAQFFGTAAVEPQPAIGHLLTIAGLAVAVALDFHIKISALFLVSYEIFPIGSLPSPTDMARWGISHVGRIFALAFSLAAPFVVASLIYNVALGVINKAMPQLMVAFVGAPAITFGGLLLLLLASPLMLEVWMDSLDSVLSHPFEVRR